MLCGNISEKFNAGSPRLPFILEDETVTASERARRQSDRTFGDVRWEARMLSRPPYERGFPPSPLVSGGNPRGGERSASDHVCLASQCQEALVRFRRENASRRVSSARHDSLPPEGFGVGGGLYYFFKDFLIMFLWYRRVRCGSPGGSLLEKDPVKDRLAWTKPASGSLGHLRAQNENQMSNHRLNSLMHLSIDIQLWKTASILAPVEKKMTCRTCGLQKDSPPTLPKDPLPG